MTDNAAIASSSTKRRSPVPDKRRRLPRAAALALVIGVTAATVATSSAALAAPVATPHHAVAAPRAIRSQPASVVPLYEQNVTAKVFYSPPHHPDALAGEFTGSLTWGASLEYYLDVHGTLQSLLGTSYLYVHFTTGGSPHDNLLLTVKQGAKATVGKNGQFEDPFLSYGDIYVYVCNQYNGYRCGAHAGPQ